VLSGTTLSGPVISRLFSVSGPGAVDPGWHEHDDRRDIPGDVWSDEALVHSIINKGSEHHFRTLMARYKTRVHHLSLSVLGPARQALAEDVTQEVFIKLYRCLDSFRGDCKFSTWVHRIAINTAIDCLRANRRFDGEELTDKQLPDETDSLSPEWESQYDSILLKRAIEQLPQTQRMMIYQFYWLELKINEIAEILGCPEGTVKVYLSRARNSLAELLEDPDND